MFKFLIPGGERRQLVGEHCPWFAFRRHPELEGLPDLPLSSLNSVAVW